MEESHVHIVELGGVFERDYTEELIILEVATASALYPSFVRCRAYILAYPIRIWGSQ